MLATIITAAAAFAATNIDDILTDTLFFAAAETGSEKLSVVAGKYLGIGILTAASLICAYTLQAVPQKFIGFLGVIPVILGVKELVLHKNTADVENVSANKISVYGITAVTLANGADNLGVYIPLFATGTVDGVLCTSVIFAFMTAVWCVLSYRLSRLPVLQKLIKNHRHIIVPAVFILLGTYIIFNGFGRV